MVVYYYLKTVAGKFRECYGTDTPRLYITLKGAQKSCDSHNRWCDNNNRMSDEDKYTVMEVDL